MGVSFRSARGECRRDRLKHSVKGPGASFRSGFIVLHRVRRRLLGVVYWNSLCSTLSLPPSMGPSSAEAALRIVSRLVRGRVLPLELVPRTRSRRSWWAWGRARYCWRVPRRSCQEPAHRLSEEYRGGAGAERRGDGESIVRSPAAGLRLFGQREEAVRSTAPSRSSAATHGRVLPAGSGHGSVAGYVVRHLSIPVLLIPGAPGRSRAAGRMVQCEAFSSRSISPELGSRSGAGGETGSPGLARARTLL